MGVLLRIGKETGGKKYAVVQQPEEFTRSRSTCRRRVRASPGAFAMSCIGL
jgi:hypothetical protein